MGVSDDARKCEATNCGLRGACVPNSCGWTSRAPYCSDVYACAFSECPSLIQAWRTGWSGECNPSTCRAAAAASRWRWFAVSAACCSFSIVVLCDIVPSALHLKLRESPRPRGLAALARRLATRAACFALWSLIELRLAERVDEPVRKRFERLVIENVAGNQI